MALGKGPEADVCSARECSEPAAYAIIWSNPKIHTGRKKTWLSCEGHREFLEQYLGYRSFPLEVITFAELKQREAVTGETEFPQRDNTAR